MVKRFDYTDKHGVLTAFFLDEETDQVEMIQEGVEHIESISANALVQFTIFRSSTMEKMSVTEARKDDGLDNYPKTTRDDSFKGGE